jgi:hypothetical protein
MSFTRVHRSWILRRSLLARKIFEKSSNKMHTPLKIHREFIGHW